MFGSLVSNPFRRNSSWSSAAFPVSVSASSALFFRIIMSFCFFFLMWTIFRVFIEFVTILLLFYVLVFWPRGIWDLSSPTRDRTCTPSIGRRSLNQWTTSEVPQIITFLTMILPKAYSAQNEDKMRCLQINKLLFFFQVGVQVFTKRPVDEQQSRFNPDDIISCLKKYPQALVKYLEHLVTDRRLQVRPQSAG